MTSTSELAATGTRSDAPARWFGTGHSDEADIGIAGTLAASAATAGRAPSLIVLFTSFDEGFDRLLGSVRDVAGPDVPILGCTTCGEITGTDVSERGVMAVALGGPGFSVQISAAAQEPGGQRDAGTALARALERSERSHQVLMILADGMVGSQHELVRGIYSTVGARIPLVGACAGSLSFRDAHHFYDDGSGPHVLHGGAVAALIGSDAPLGIGVAHGWRPCGEPMNLTEVADSWIQKIDHQSALDVYLGRLGVDDSVAYDPGVFFVFAHSHPLGISRRGGEDIRVVNVADLRSRSMAVASDVQQGAVAWLMETDPDALATGGADSCGQALAGLGDVAPLGVLSFDCSARKLQLGPDGVRREIAQMRELMGAAPLVGFYSMGEIARTRGMRGMHHMTSVTLAFG